MKKQIIVIVLQIITTIALVIGLISIIQNKKEACVEPGYETSNPHDDPCAFGPNQLV